MRAPLRLDNRNAQIAITQSGAIELESAKFYLEDDPNSNSMTAGGFHQLPRAVKTVIPEVIDLGKLAEHFCRQLALCGDGLPIGGGGSDDIDPDSRIVAGFRL